MTDLKKLHTNVLLELDFVNSYFKEGILPSLSHVQNMDDVNNQALSKYYRYLTALMLQLKPRSVVELGGAMGTGTLMMLAGLPEDTPVYSITLAEHGLEFSFIPHKPDNLRAVVGDDLDLSLWPEDLDWDLVDFMFIDTIHTYDQVKKELALYGPLLREGTIVAFDDIHLNEGMVRAWEEIPWNKISLPELHHSGWGLVEWGVA